MRRRGDGIVNRIMRNRASMKEKRKGSENREGKRERRKKATEGKECEK